MRIPENTAEHHREEDYKKLDPADVAYYDGCVYVDLRHSKTNDRSSVPSKQCL